MDPPDPGHQRMPERVVPMLAQLGDLPPDPERYGFEVKWDGIRALAYWRPGRLHLETRNLADVTGRWPELRDLGRQLGARRAVLDGEIVTFDDDGRPSFERLQSRMHLTGEAAIRRRAQEIPAVYVVFDLLWLDDASLMDRPYHERRAALEQLDLRGPAWQTPAYHRGDGAALLTATREQGLEGIVAKRLDSHYEPGRRGGAWIKVEHTRRRELVIGGWLRGETGQSERPAEQREVEVDGHRVRLTNLRKVLYPEAAFTKAEVLYYYARIAPTLLPHLRGRAMTLKRYPDGVAGPHFYDKHCRGAPPWVETAPMWSERKREDINFCRLEDTASLLWSVNHGNLEMHPLLSIAPDFDTPTTVVFDLDPGEGATILDAAEIALILHDMLRGIALESFAKSSGSKGVQVYVPLNSPATFEQTKAFSRHVADVMAARLSERVVARIEKRHRTGKVLIDWGQNDRHKSTVAPHSLRAKLGRPTVSLPVTWDDLAAAVDAGDSAALLPAPQDALDRVDETGDVFAPVLSLTQRLPG
jgi:bifunctional non-homologous end joining protein LigD